MFVEHDEVDYENYEVEVEEFLVVEEQKLLHLLHFFWNCSAFGEHYLYVHFVL